MFSKIHTVPYHHHTITFIQSTHQCNSSLYISRIRRCIEETQPRSSAKPLFKALFTYLFRVITASLYI